MHLLDTTEIVRKHFIGIRERLDDNEIKLNEFREHLTNSISKIPEYIWKSIVIPLGLGIGIYYRGHQIYSDRVPEIAKEIVVVVIGRQEIKQQTRATSACLLDCVTRTVYICVYPRITQTTELDHAHNSPDP